MTFNQLVIQILYGKMAGVASLTTKGNSSVVSVGSDFVMALQRNGEDKGCGTMVIVDYSTTIAIISTNVISNNPVVNGLRVYAL